MATEITKLIEGCGELRLLLPGWERELAFTALHASLQGADALRREGACQALHIRHLAAPVRAGDLLAGRMHAPRIGHSPEAPLYGYYCDFPALRREILARRGREREILTAVFDYWKEHNTVEQIRRGYNAAQRQAFPDNSEFAWKVKPDWAGELDQEYFAHFHSAWTQETPGPQVSYALYRVAGMIPNYKLVMREGLPGLRAMTLERKARGGGGEAFCEAILQGLDAVQEIGKNWLQQAVALENQELIICLHEVLTNRPRTFYHCLQLHALWAVATQSINVGRMDIWAGPFLQQDLDSGVLTSDRALELLSGSFALMSATEQPANQRIVCGGEGVTDRRSSNTFTLLALDAVARRHDILPVLTLRLNEDTPDDILERAWDVQAQQNTFPIYYNDKVNVEAYAEAAGLERWQAQEYFMLGCGEYTLPGMAMTTPNGTINLPMALLATLNNGVDPASGRQIGIDCGRLHDYHTFADLLQAYQRQVEFQVDQLALAQKQIYEVSARELQFPLASLTYHNCLARGKGIINGGIDLLGGTLETYGNITCSDSLEGLRQVYYEAQACDADTLLAALRTDFADQEKLRLRFKRVEKFGNDLERADRMALFVHNHVCDYTRSCARKVGLSSYLVVVINNIYHEVFGRATGATTDGRRAGGALSNGNMPTAGNDRSGMTGVFNSICKLPCEHHAGAVHSFNVNRRLLTVERRKFRALFEGYLKSGGSQIMFTPVDPGMLEAAIEHPEKYPDLMVRIGGLSLRFVEMDPRLQRDIAQRTLQGAM